MNKTTPAAKESGREAASGRKMWVVAGAAACGAIIVVVGVVLAGKAMSDSGPRLNADTVTLVKWVNTPEYLKQSFARQSDYMKVLEDRDDNGELDSAYERKALSEEQYRTAKMEAWLGEQLRRSERYAGLPAGPARVKYISDLLDRKVKKKQAEEKEAKPKRPASSDEEQPQEVKRDQTVEEIRIKSWPEDVRRQWEDFRRAYEEQKETRQKAGVATGKGGQD